MSKEEQIRSLLAFDDNDLFANRNGRFSRKQKEKFEELDDWSSKFLLFFAILFLAGAIWRAVVLLNAKEEWTAWILPVVLIAISIWFFSGASNKTDTMIEKAEDVVNFVKVESKTGSIADSEIDRFTIQSYEMRVGGIAFTNANPALTEHMQGDVYAVYYTNSTQQVLSAEFISKGN